MKYNQGLTLIELIITIAIAATLFSTAIPNFSAFINKSKANSSVHLLFRTFQLARTEALNRNNNIYLCGSNDGYSCHQHWSYTLLLFIDNNDDKKPSSDEIISQHYFKLKGHHIKTRAAFGRPYIKISKRGSAVDHGSFIFCPKNQEPRHYRRVTWNKSGRPYFGRDSNQDGVIEDTNGKPLRC